VNASEPETPRGDGTGEPGPDTRPEDLPGILDGIASKLTADHRHLTGPRRPGTGAPGGFLTYLREGVETAEADIDQVQNAVGICSSVLGESSSRELSRLEQSVFEAKETVYTALLAFDAPEAASPFKAQSQGYFSTVKELKTLADRCSALARRLRGPSNLPPRHER
jgi:hypothetical protein